MAQSPSKSMSSNKTITSPSADQRKSGNPLSTKRISGGGKKR